MRLLVVGDIVGKPGRMVLKSFLDEYKENYDFIIVNGENSAGGFGITEDIAEEFFSYGIDVITSGNHIWDKKDFYSYLEKNNRVLRPLNYPEGAPGFGYVKLEKNSKKIAVISLQGRVFMPPIDCPFRIGEGILNKLKDESDIIVIDFHAEATSEKKALGWHFDGEATLIYGTHTHVQTSDETILLNGTAYITDIGMTGSDNGIIGMNKDFVIAKFLTALPQRFEVAKGNESLNGIDVLINDTTNRCEKIERINWRLG